MASWVLAHHPWHALLRVRLRWDGLVKSGSWTRKKFLSTPPLTTETPAMRQVKAYPYPESAPDATLFEDASQEYHEAAGGTEGYTALYPVDSVTDHPSMLLKELVKAGKYRDATRVHSELVQMGVGVVQHPVYHFAACQALRDRSLTPQERTEAFVQWWSLFPPRTEIHDAERSIHSVFAETLREDPAPDVPLLIRFALLAASKGYARLVAEETIPAITRYGSARVALRFLEEFCTTAWNYEMSLVEDNRHPRDLLDQLLNDKFPVWYSSAIKELADTGRTSSAMGLLHLARSRGMRIRQSACGALSRLFRREPNAEAVAMVARIRRLQDGESELPEDLTGEACSSHEHMHVTVKPDSPGTWPPSAGLFPGSSPPWVKIPRSLKRSSAKGKSLVSAEQLWRLVTTYQFVSRLRARAYQHEKLYAQWASAELLRYRTSDSALTTLVQVFESHFHVVGVPRIQLDVRLSGPVPWRQLIRRKLAPSAWHTLLMWDAFVERARTRSQVQRLYIQFLRNVATSRELPVSSVPFVSSQPPIEPNADLEEHRTIPPPSLFDTCHFAVFMRAFERVELPRVSSRVILDMYHLGFEPNYEVFPAFVSSLRHLPSDSPPTPMLDFFEEQIDEGDRVTKDSRSPRTQTLVFVYTGVMRRLLLDKRRADAEEVADRFKAKVPYHVGSNAATDEVLRELGVATEAAAP
ncbi:hypothetical protein BV20DRAFT_542217 [Pilatotrama ljubarskyi]|nr:hypothetical protein BV20DRAFT_542217 [Pilatotrama ljubarskyi]